MIRLRQTGRTNDRPCNDRPRVMSQCQDRHLRLIRIRNRMITAEDTARRTPGLANVRILGQTVRKWLRESGLRARRPVVGQILKQHHRTARLTWAHARRRRRLLTWQHILSSDESRFSLRFSDGRYHVYRRRGERFTDNCVYESVLEAEVLWSGLKFVMMIALSSICSRNIECRKIQRRYPWPYRSALSATAKLWSRLSTWQCKMSRGSCLSKLYEPKSHPCSSLVGIITGSVTNWTFMGWSR